MGGESEREGGIWLPKPAGVTGQGSIRSGLSPNNKRERRRTARGIERGAGESCQQLKIRHTRGRRRRAGRSIEEEGGGGMGARVGIRCRRRRVVEAPG